MVVVGLVLYLALSSRVPGLLAKAAACPCCEGRNGPQTLSGWGDLFRSIGDAGRWTLLFRL
jgi:hypothetical protein